MGDALRKEGSGREEPGIEDPGHQEPGKRPRDNPPEPNEPLEKPADQLRNSRFADEDAAAYAGIVLTIAVAAGHRIRRPREADVRRRAVDTARGDTLRNEGPGREESPSEEPRSKQPWIDELERKEPEIEDAGHQEPCERALDNPPELDMPRERPRQKMPDQPRATAEPRAKMPRGRHRRALRQLSDHFIA